MADHKQAAVDFLQMVVAGDIEKAYEKYVDMKGKHHNSFTPAGFPALQKGMLENHAQFPDKKITIQHVVGEGDWVSVHSHVVLKAGELELGTMHLIHFRDGKMVEMWDLGQQMPKDSPNKDGMF
jgi:predicted SnoaL-like aldol condensation-catalyzing enzyme